MKERATKQGSVGSKATLQPAQELLRSRSRRNKKSIAKAAVVILDSFLSFIRSLEEEDQESQVLKEEKKK